MTTTKREVETTKPTHRIQGQPNTIHATTKMYLVENDGSEKPLCSIVVEMDEADYNRAKAGERVWPDQKDCEQCKAREAVKLWKKKHPGQIKQQTVAGARPVTQDGNQ